MGGAIPLATAALKLGVMFAILLRLDFTLALLPLVVVPFLYGSLRHYARHMLDRAEQVKARESALVERVFEILSSIAVVKSFAREPYELQRFATAGRRR
jgi:ABC-type multidrug transport system fused ATPase/permease subunit